MVNNVTLIGRLGKDPEWFASKSGDAGKGVCKFSLATDKSYKDQNGEWQTNTQWHNIVLFNATGERASKILKKGTLIYVEGGLEYDEYVDKDGVKRYSTSIIVESFKPLEKASTSSATTTNTDEPTDKPTDGAPF
jgi:single-strand DNA-binding protein